MSQPPDVRAATFFPEPVEGATCTFLPEPVEDVPRARDENDDVGVHASHCCVVHGCKYSDKACPVEQRRVRQEVLCEHCTLDRADAQTPWEAILHLDGEPGWWAFVPMPNAPYQTLIVPYSQKTRGEAILSAEALRRILGMYTYTKGLLADLATEEPVLIERYFPLKALMAMRRQSRWRMFWQTFRRMVRRHKIVAQTWQGDVVTMMCSCGGEVLVTSARRASVYLDAMPIPTQFTIEGIISASTCPKHKLAPLPKARLLRPSGL